MNKSKSSRSRFIFIIGLLGRVIVGGSGGGNKGSFVRLFLYVMCTISISRASLLKNKSMQ